MPTQQASSILHLSLEELLRTSESFLAFDPQTRAEFMARIEAMDESQKEGLRTILIEERLTMMKLNEEEARAKAAAREKVVNQFEVSVTNAVHKFEREVREDGQKSAEARDRAKANALLNNL